MNIILSSPVITNSLPTNQPLDATEKTTPPDAQLKATQLITITAAQQPIGYDSSELYNKHQTVSAIEQPEQAILESTLTNKLSDQVFSGYSQISGIYSRVSEVFESNQTEINQTSTKTLFSTRIKEFDPLEHTERIQTNSKQDVSTQLVIKTKEGDEFTFNINVDYTSGILEGNAGTYSSKNISINMEIGGSLSDKEKKAIEEITAALDQQLSQIQRGKEFDFSKLNIFSDDIISNISFSMRMGASSLEAISLDITNSEDNRSIDFKLGEQKINLNLDTTTLYTNKSDQDQVIKDLIESLENSLTEARDPFDKGQALIEATKALLSNLPSNSKTNTASRLTQSITSGLPDFNIHYKHDDHVKLEVEQQTYINQDNLKLDVRQTYNFNLEYHYLKPLPHLERPDTVYKNYISVTGSEQQTRTSTLSTDDNGRITKASVIKDASKSISELTYSEGKLVDSWQSEQILNSHKDLIAEVSNTQEHKKLLMVEGIMQHLSFDDPLLEKEEERSFDGMG